MVLRLLLIALVVANIGYFLWARAAAGDAADREPQRLTQQVRPELLEIRKTPSAASPRTDTAPVPASAATR